MSAGPSLRELQRWMKRRVQPDSMADPGETPLNPQGGAPGEERMAVYAEGYLVRIREALDETYEAVRQVLGREAFADLARDYARRHPSRDYNLSRAGRHLPAFLAEHPLTRELPFLPDLAALEWAVSGAFHAFEQPPISSAELASLSEGTAGQAAQGFEVARLRFQPAVRLVSSEWPILDIWEQRKRPRGEVSVDLAGRPQRVLIFRQGVHVRCESLEPAQHDLLAGLLVGRTLGEACGELAAQEGAAELPLSGWFAGWVQRGLITGLAPAGSGQ